mmetsp:Transcript_8692/g.10701  ORF Transcript_8692/g.10701 Transcript_8692/m.10701 type:complete len:198 (-) Transcript_8692:67-660(-)
MDIKKAGHSNKKGPKCCMCRRRVEEKYNKKKTDGDSTFEDKDIMHGWRLTLCGCLFCRQCFVNFVYAKLKANGIVECYRCDTVVLASDCENIIKPIFKKNVKSPEDRSKFEMYEKDWKSITNLSVIKYCSDMAQFQNGMESLVCPDCITPVIYKANKGYFYCRNRNCPNQFCSRCRRVLSKLTLQQCKKKSCKQTTF